MSLHLGNLSSRTRRDELEHVFRRFGKCNVRMKDKYGFVVFDYPASAEKALKALKGKRICGEPITLSWSNNQPRAKPRFRGSGKAHDPRGRMYSAKGNDQRFGSNGRPDHNIDSASRKVGPSELGDETRRYGNHDHEEGYEGEKGLTSLENYDEVRAAEQDHIEDDRWEEQIAGPSDENFMGNGLEFDRYEPYHSDEKMEQHEKQSVSHFDVSQIARKTQDAIGTDQNDFEEMMSDPNDLKSRDTCYRCGQVGHRKRNCPLEQRSPPLRHQIRENKRYTPTERRPLRHRYSPRGWQASQGRTEDYRERKRSRRVNESSERDHLMKRSRTSASDYYESRSLSPSVSLRSSSRSASHSRSKSALSRKNSASSSSRSSASSGAKCHRSQRISGSTSTPTLSLAVAKDSHLTSSVNKVRAHQDKSLVNSVGPVSSKDLSEDETLGTSNAGYNKPVNGFEGPSNVEDEQMKDDVPRNIKNCDSFLAGFTGHLDSHTPESDDPTMQNILLQSVTGVEASRNGQIVVEHTSVPELNAPLIPEAGNSRIPSEEIYMVLKHYGLDYPEGSEKDLPVETYFGSACLWPWEIIYYRRLRKGPISAENYARRIMQNEEFGIIDKYIRGSSGWGESNEENP